MTDQMHGIKKILKDEQDYALPAKKNIYFFFKHKDIRMSSAIYITSCCYITCKMMRFIFAFSSISFHLIF